MKKQILTLLLLLSVNLLPAQVAQWIVPPYYDSIYFATGADLIVTDSMNQRVFWEQNGHRLFATSEKIQPFSEGFAVTTNDADAITGFYDTKGRYTSLANNKISVANNYPYFSNGYLIVRNESYYLADTQGNIIEKKYLRVYPFCHGYAVCRDYENPQREKGVARFLIDLDRNVVPLIYKGKPLNPADIDFISSVGNEGKGYIVMNKYVYVFDATTWQVEPLYFPDHNLDSKPPQAKVDGERSNITGDNAPVIYAKCGNDQIFILFDDNLVPVQIHYNAEKHVLNNETYPETSKSLLAPTKSDSLYGLMWDRKPIIPTQFDMIIRCFDNYAFVQFAGKYGMLQIKNDETFDLTINDGKDIPFRHQIVKTTLQIDMSTSLDPELIDLDIDPSLKCRVDKVSKVHKKTNSANRATYNCYITIPHGITEKISEFEYPIHLKYDGIKLFPKVMKVKGWHYKCYDIVINDNEKEFDKENNLFSFPYTISTERYSDEETFPFEISILPDTLDVEIHNISETRGMFKMPMTELRDGTNYLFIQLTEQGCPAITFPFVLTYNKPSAKSKKSTKKEDVQIKKKTIQELDNDLKFPVLCE